MSERQILVADNNNEVRRQMADSFRAAGYDVETTDSAVHVFCTVLEKQIPVVLLGSGFDNKMALADLVRLLKQCNRHLTIILVSDEESLPTMRTVRQEGIFYHALTPNSQEDTAEILSAVGCAFEKSGKINRKLYVRRAAGHAAASAAAEQSPEDRIQEQAPARVPGPVETGASRKPWQQEDGKMRAKTAAVLVALTGAVAGFVYCAVEAALAMKERGEIVIWGFLGFCALIIVGQLIPAFFSLRSARKVMEQKLREELATGNRELQSEAVFDRTK